jgi:hypothetical protein
MHLLKAIVEVVLVSLILIALIKSHVLFMLLLRGAGSSFEELLRVDKN